jgi:predicted small integral membrane protein
LFGDQIKNFQALAAMWISARRATFDQNVAVIRIISELNLVVYEILSPTLEPRGGMLKKVAAKTKSCSFQQTPE